MDPSDLEDRIVSTVQEMQVKLGQSSGSLSLYLPLDCLDGDVEEEIARFREHVRPKLGDVACTLDDGRVRITVSEEGCRYVAGLPVSPVLLTMVDAVMSRESLDGIKARLEKVSKGLVWKEVDGDGFDHIAYFTDGTDPYVYCIDSDCGPISYHRFSRRDYEVFGFGGLDGA
ncbi:MAG: DUF3877 family protein [Candidatus Methanomethylophilaceae archaeon]